MIYINKLMIRINPNLKIDDLDLAYKSIRCARLYEQEKGEIKSIKVSWQNNKTLMVYDKGFNDAIFYSYGSGGDSK